MLGMTKAALSAWNAGRRQPSFATALEVSKLFKVSADRLANAPFEDLLSNELSDPERFRLVEAEIQRRKALLAEGKPFFGSKAAGEVLALHKDELETTRRKKGR